MDEIDTPALVIDAARLRANVAAMAAIASRAGVALRPHAKTHKMLEVAALQLRDAVGLTVAKLGEAEVFVAGGCEDVLIAYPLVGGAKLERLVALAERARVAVALDGAEVVDAGTKALSSDPLNAPGAPADFGAVAGAGWPVVRASEEHGVIELPPDAELAVGARVVLVPNHVCPVVNLFDEAVIVEDGVVVGRWRVAARGLSR